MARPARPERSRSARSSRQLSRFYHSINPDRVFGTHNGCRKPKLADTGGNLSNLLLRMCTGVFGVRPDLFNRQDCVPVRHGDAPLAGTRASTRMSRQKTKLETA